MGGSGTHGGVRSIATDYTRLQSFLGRAVKLDYNDKKAIVGDMFQDADDALFRKILYCVQ